MDSPLTANPFTPVRSVRLSEEIVRQITKLVEDGTLRLDERFPSERELQVAWQVSRPVLREAFRILEMQGIVESRPGAGRYLRSEHIPPLESMRRTRVIMDREHLFQLWQAREAIEGKAAELAARHASRGHIARIETTLDVLETASFEDVKRYDFNRAFHLAVAEASCNPVIEEVVSSLIRRSSQIGFKESLDRRDWSSLRGRHQPIFDAIRSRDPQAARQSIVDHFQSMRACVTG